MHAYTFRFPQEVETDPSVLTYGRFRVRFAYGRSGDSRKNNDPGQDYMALRLDHERLAFVLCDGVSQSFYGDLAAHVLGDLLLDWLWAQQGKLTNDRFQQELTAQLNSWTAQGREAVERFHLPDDLAPMVHGVLEKKRALGSETMFVAGLLTLPGRDLPDGQLCLAWLGDSRLQLHRADLDLTSSLGADFSSEYRWSTHTGVKSGEPGVYIKPPGAAERVLAFSDGLEPVEHLLVEAGEADLGAYIQDLQTSPTSDDISFLDMMLMPEAGREKVPLIAPLAPKVGEGGPGSADGPSQLSWKPVAAAEGYELALELADGSVRTLQTAEAFYPFEAVEGAVAVRVRALRADEAGPWSGWAEIKPAAVPVQETLAAVPEPAAETRLVPVEEPVRVPGRAVERKPARPVWLPWVPAAAVVILALVFGPRLLGGGDEPAVETDAVVQVTAAEEEEPEAPVEAVPAEEVAEAAPAEAGEEPVEETVMQVQPLWLNHPDTLSAPPDGGLVRVGKGLPVDARFSTDTESVFLLTGTSLYSLDPGTLVETGAAAAESQASSMAVSPDGAELAVGDTDGSVSIYDQADLLILSTTALSESAVRVLVYSPDGAWLAAGFADGSVQLRGDDPVWSEVIAPGTSAAASLAFSSDGSQLACAFSDGGLAQYSLTGEEITPLRYFLEHEQLMAYADGWLSRLSNGALVAWDMRGEITARYPGRFSQMALIPDGDILLADMHGSLVKLSADGMAQEQLAAVPDLVSLASTKEGRVLWMSRAGEIGVTADGEEPVLLQIAPAALHTAWLDASEGRLYWTGPEGGVQGCSLEDGAVLADLPPVRSQLSSLSGFDSTLVSGFSAGGALLLEPGAGTLDVLLAYPGEVTAVAVSSAGGYAAAGTVEGAVSIWDLAWRDWRVTVFSGRSPVTALAVDRLDPGLLWVANANGRLAGWDSASGSLVRELVEQGPALTALAVSPDGSLLAYAEAGGVVVLDAAGEAEPIRLDMVQPVALAFSPDGNLAMGTTSGDVLLWSGECMQLAVFSGHTGPVVSLDFEAGGEVLWSASLDGTAISWDVSGE